MQAGKLRHRITIQKRKMVANDFGEMIEEWSDFATVWAFVEPNAGRRYFEAMQANADVKGIVHIRYRLGIEPTMQILYAGRILKVISVVQTRENRQELQIYYDEDLD